MNVARRIILTRATRLILSLSLAVPQERSLLTSPIIVTTAKRHGSSTSTEAMAPARSFQNEKVTHLPKELLPEWMLAGRTKILVGDAAMMTKTTSKPEADASSSSDKKKTSSSIIYVMQRDVRTKDNWALLLAGHFAEQRHVPLRVVYALPSPPPPPWAANTINNDSSIDAIPADLKNLPMTERHGKFLLGGLACVHEELKDKNIPLHIVMPSSHETVGQTIWTEVIEKYNGEMVITDFSPLRHCRECTEWQLAPILSSHNAIPFVQVDAHNVVPVWIASDKREYGARTIRPKIHRLLDTYLQSYPRFKDFTVQANDDEKLELPDFRQTLYEDYMKMDGTVKELAWAKPGTEAALTQAEQFFNNGLKQYDKLRNDPNHRSVCSTLSPWLNHGHVSFQRLALAVKKFNKYPDGTKSFLEEGIVRRELSDNFLYYAPNNYDSLTCAYDWAQETLRVHAPDRREYVYSWQELERGDTYDDLWNAAQLQAVVDGKMHGFLRMYWAKKILEWTESPEAALKIAQYLNDKFNIDGRDPNGFVGVGWSIMGLHDQGWKEREVFGKIRYMVRPS
jgi:deoxyribodipyrimidine photo-lyase